MTNPWLKFKGMGRVFSLEGRGMYRSPADGCLPCGSLELASYEHGAFVEGFNQKQLLVRPSKICNPGTSVVFLFCNLLPIRYAGGSEFPHYIVTDGEKWCPLLATLTGVEAFSPQTRMNYISYNYSGMMLSRLDRTAIRASIRQFARSISDE